MTRSLVVIAALAGCVPSSRELRAPVERERAQRLGDAELAGDATREQVRAAIAERLARPLDKAAAVRIALANSPRVRAALAELGIAGGNLALARAIGPADLDLDLRLKGGLDYELDVTQDVIALIAGAPRRAAAHAELAAAQAAATATALRLAARVEIAFQDLLAAQQEAELRRTAFDAADAAALVRERMHAAGNAPDLALARDRDAREQARVDLARAEAAIEVRREAVNGLLGVTGEHTRWAVAGRLPELPAQPPALDELEARAVAANLDLAAGRARIDAAANDVIDQRRRAFLPRLGLGVSVHRDHDDGTVGVGPAISVGVPLLDWNWGGRARAHATLRRAEHELTATALELRAQSRAARITALAAHQEARHLRDVILPLRQQIVDETLKHYNAMNVDPFALVLARRELVDAGQQYLDALRRYWNAIAEVTALERGVAVDAVPPAQRRPAAPPPRAPEHRAGGH